jgi:hypothetical protein
MDKDPDRKDTGTIIASGGMLPEFEAAFGEPLSRTLDLSTWNVGEDLASAYARLEKEVNEAVAQEDSYRAEIRKAIFPKLATLPGAPPNGGVYLAARTELERIHRGLLFNGGVEACDGVYVVHDTLPLSITQIGVCLVGYSGEQGAWVHRLFRRDLRNKQTNIVDEVLTLLDRRQKREAQGQSADRLSELATRGIMTYAERAILRDKSTASWRIGHGSPVPYELLTGLWASNINGIQTSIDLIRWFVHEHKRFVFVPSAPRKRHLLMIGNALRPLEYAIVQTVKSDLSTMSDTGGYRGPVEKAMEDLVGDIGDKIIVGLYKVWEAAPPYLFYAHVEHAHLAAQIVMADSILQEHRGFPMMIDLADTVCRTTFGAETLLPSVQMAYTSAGQPFQYLSERETRDR